MSIPEKIPRHEIGLFIEHAYRMLEVATHNLSGGFYGSAINRAYYAIFYAACALLTTQSATRSKHSGVVAAFRRLFVKPGFIEAEYSEIYGRVMDDRHISDYDIEMPIEPDRAQRDLEDARRFVQRVERYLREGEWL
jgi:uncharacterized protein (UPF0332 family)